jgi:phosphate transport system substrate-binding protein
LSDTKAATTRTDYQSSANDNVIIQGIEGSPSSLGWVGYAYYKENQSQIKAIAIDNGDGKCIAPTDQTIETKTYPLSRDLYIYVNTSKLASNPAVKPFVDYYLSDPGLASVTEVGYLAEPSAVIQKTQQTWASKKTGTQATS